MSRPTSLAARRATSFTWRAIRDGPPRPLLRCARLETKAPRQPSIAAEPEEAASGLEQPEVVAGLFSQRIRIPWHFDSHARVRSIAGCPGWLALGLMEANHWGRC